MSTATATKTRETKTNKWGFPIVTCYRCNGSGRYSFNPLDGDRCFGCKGSGWAIKRGKAAKAWQAFLDAQPARVLSVCDMLPGDRFNYQGEWVTVADTALTDEWYGSSETGYRDAENNFVKTYQGRYYVIITLTDGRELRLGENHAFEYKKEAWRFPNPEDFTRGL